MTAGAEDFLRASAMQLSLIAGPMQRTRRLRAQEKCVTKKI
jgi:hypothetical protein